MRGRQNPLGDLASVRSSSSAPMTKNLFDSAKLLLDRAREHREEFHRRSKAWLDGHPYTTLIEPYPNTGEYVLKAKIEGIAGFLFPIAADALNNLRHALDHAVCASVLAKDGASDLTGICFPFGKNETSFNDNLAKTRKNAAPEIVAAVRALKPYRGGDDKLWGLSHLTNVSKHRSLIALYPEIKRLGIGPYSVFNNDQAWSRPIWDSTKNELTAAIAPAPEELNYNLNLEFYIGFGDVEIFQRKSVVAVIEHFLKRVEAINANIEVKTKRLFPAAF
jgi:hypothetical protein